MTTLTKNRVQSIDLLKGLVMVIMALDHTRDYFHASAYLFDPAAPAQTTWYIYLTRWITHYCAPTFSLLAGISAYLVGRRKTKNELSVFLFKRGLWLVFIELTVVNFAWFFDWEFRNDSLAVIWSLGISMMVLAALVQLPRFAILAFSLTVILGHDLLDTVHYKGNIWWAILHDGGDFRFSDNFDLFVAYPLVPWIAVMSFGYCMGSIYDAGFDVVKRKKILNIMGIVSILLFIIIRWINVYGDPYGWQHFDTISKSMMSFLNPNKYPPSLLYLLMTLGIGFLFLANSENWKGKVVDFFCVYGRVPFFYYILHLYLIHILAMAFAQFTGYGYQSMLLSKWVSEVPALKGFGFPLWVVYSVWIAVVLLLYPLCKMFDNYKQKHKEKWWLSYL